MEKIKLILVDDHIIVRDGLKSLLQYEDDIEVIGDCSSYSELSVLLTQIVPDILIVDISLPEISGIEITKIITQKYSNIKVIILTMYTDEDFIFNSLKAGAKGFLPKNTSKREFLEAIREVYKSNDYFSDDIKNLILKSYVRNVKIDENPEKNYKEILTKREEEILKLCVEGLGNREIAKRLFISTRTVESHKNHLMNKLEIKTNLDLIKFAINNKIVTF